MGLMESLQEDFPSADKLKSENSDTVSRDFHAKSTEIIQIRKL